MNSKFKAGDKVKCIKKSEYGFVGNVGDILIIKNVNEFGSLDFENHSQDKNDKTRFELTTNKEVPKPPAKKIETGWGFEE